MTLIVLYYTNIINIDNNICNILCDKNCFYIVLITLLKFWLT